MGATHAQGPTALAKLLSENGVECKVEVPQTHGKRERYELLEPIKTKKTRRSRKHKEDKKSSKKKSKKHKRSKKRRRSSSGSSSSDDLLGFGASQAMTSDEEGESAAAGKGPSRIAGGSSGAPLAASAAMMRIRFPVLGQNRKTPESVQVRFAEAVDFVCGQSLRFWLQALNTESL